MTHSLIGSNEAPAWYRREPAGGCLLLWIGALFVLVLSGPLCAAETDELAEVVVTGSRLNQANATSTNPVVVVDNDELLHQGTAKAEDLLNSLPQVNSGLTPSANGASVAPLTGTATADLRGFGAFRTLVLVNGRRTAPGDPINPSADLNTIPTALIKRVEVLTGGASAIYGSDAVAGVVNFILDTDFTGLKFDMNGGVYRGSNSRGDLQAVERAAGVTPPSSSSYDGRNLDASLVWGSAFHGQDGHIHAYAGFRHVQQVSGARRDFSACTLIEVGGSFECLLDNSTARGQFVPGGGTPFTLDSATGAIRPLAFPSDYYNPAALQDLQRPDTRYNAGLFFSYQLAASSQLYGEAQYMRDTTTVHYEPTATDAPNPYNPHSATYAGFLPATAYTINCADPQLSAGEVAALCAGITSGTATVNIGRRNIEGGQRSDEFRHDSYRVVLGLKGQLSNPWSYDADVTFGRVKGRETLSNDFSASRLANSLNVVAGTGGAPTCQSVIDGSDPACIPYDIWQIGGVTPAALQYLREGGRQSGYAQRTVVTGQLVGDLKSYGIKSPAAENGVSIAVGAEYRTESVHYAPDAAYAAGDLVVTSALNGTPHPTNGSFHVSEVFAETHVPLIQDRPFAGDLSLHLSDRYAHYTPQGNVNAYGMGLEWAPVEMARLRGSVSRAVRAPNAYELFTPQLQNQVASLTDPCAGPVPAATQVQCAGSGVSAAQYGHIAAGPINVLVGGNPLLKPETADSYTYGVVINPVRSLLFSVDYWRIKVRRFVGNVSAAYILPACIGGGDPTYCGLIVRDASGSLSGPGGGHVASTRLNTGSYATSGVDLEGRYALDLAAGDRLTFSFTGSYSIDNPIAVNPATQPFDCTGLYGFNCSGNGPTSPVPRWRHRLRTTWRTAQGLEMSLNWRHIGKLESEYANSRSGVADPTLVFPADSHIPAYDYLDFDAGMEIAAHVNLRMGINNLTDKQPPVIGWSANPQLVNGNMAAGMYDSLGRYLFAGVTLTF